MLSHLIPHGCPWESACDYPHFADEGTEAQRGGQVTKIRGLAWSPEFLMESKSHALAHYQRLHSDSLQTWLHYQGAVCLQPQRGLLDVDSIGGTELSPFLVIYELLP